jgi:hypothetical protein
MQTILPIFVWLYFSLFCHEVGHLVCAKLVGLPPRLIKVGIWFNIFRGRFLGAQLELNILPAYGLTFAHHPDSDWSTFEDLRLKLIIYSLGGCLANSALLIGSLTMLVFTGLPIFRLFSFLEVLMIIAALIPEDLSLYGNKIPSDGKNIFFLLTKKYHRYFFFSGSVQEEIASIAGDQAPPKILFKNDKRALELYVKAETAFYYLHYDEIVALLSELLSGESASDAERAYLLDWLSAIVINHGQKQYLSQADAWSEEAMKYAGHAKTIQGTRGAILIELGKYEEGRKLLFPLTEEGNDLFDIAISSYYLAKADHHLGNGEQARIWLKKAEMVGDRIPGVCEMFAGIKKEVSESNRAYLQWFTEFRQGLSGETASISDAVTPRQVDRSSERS